MNKTKTQKGITLVALIITIVVLLILAVVAIGAVKNSNIIAHTQTAGSSYTIEQEKEQIGLALNEWDIEKVIQGNNPVFKTVIVNALQGQIEPIQGNDEGPLTVTFTKTGNVYTVTKDGEINEVKPVISITPTDITIAIGETVQITPKLTGIEGTITYTSSSTNVATVSTEGLVTGQTEGEAIITVSCGDYSTKCKVTVSNKKTDDIKAYSVYVPSEDYKFYYIIYQNEFIAMTSNSFIPEMKMPLIEIEDVNNIEIEGYEVITNGLEFKQVYKLETEAVLLGISTDGTKLYTGVSSSDDNKITFSTAEYMTLDSDFVSQYYNESTDIEYYSAIEDGVPQLMVVDYINEKITAFVMTDALYKVFEYNCNTITQNDAPVNITVAGEPVKITTNAKKINYDIDVLDVKNRNAYIENNKLYFYYGASNDENEHGIVEGRVLNGAVELTKFVNKALLTGE